MGSVSLGLAFTNVGPLALWLSTLLVSFPWLLAPVFGAMIGFHLQLIGIDMLHVFHLGIGRDLCGTALKILVQRRDFFYGSNLEKRLLHCSKQLKQFAKNQKLGLRLRKLSKANLNWKGNDYPEIRCKGSDTATTLKFLVHLTQQPTWPDDLHELATCLWASDFVVRLLTNCGNHLTAAEAEQVETVGLVYIRT